MIVKEQKTIEFINQCGCLFDYKQLTSAIIWYSDKPVAQKKAIYLYGKYPAVSIYDQKVHIHRLLMMYWHDRELDTLEYVHHCDGNVLNNHNWNLKIQPTSYHQSRANKGRKQTPEHIAKRIDATTKTRYGHSIYENPELLEV